MTVKKKTWNLKDIVQSQFSEKFPLLNRILNSKGHLYDITDKKTASFKKSQQSFTDAIKELKANGKGDVESYPEIQESGRYLMLFALLKQYTTSLLRSRLRRLTSYTKIRRITACVQIGLNTQ